MKNKSLSKSVPRGTRTIWRYLGALFILFTFAVGQMWGADPTHESPSIVTKASRTFLNLASTPSNVTVSTDSYSNYGPGYFVSNKNADLSASWWSFTGTFKSSSSSYSNVSGAVGFHEVGSSSSSEFYQILQMRTGSDRMTQMDFYVTGTTQMGFQWKNGGTSGKYLTFSIYEMDVTGATATDGASPVSTVQGTITSSSDQYAASATLDGSKYYHVVVTPLNTSNINFYGLTFKHAPATKHHVTYSLGGDYGTIPTQADVAEGAKFNLHNGTTGITPPTGKQFGGWNDGTTTYAGSAEYTMGTSDVTLTAQWENTKTDPTATLSAGAYVVGESALDLSGLWSSNSDGAVTYALKEASDDAEVSGTSFTATKAGSYVVVASQAATSTYNAIEKEATITVTWPATGAADILFNIATGTSNTALGTASKEAHSASINTLSNFTAAGGLTVSGLGAGKDGLSTKLQTLSEKDADKYIYVTFNVVDGYIFTINSVTTKVVAVTSPKTIEVALSDATTNESLNYNQTNNSSAATHVYEFAGKAYEGTVTLKIYAYGATDHYRLAAPLTISGTVAVKPSPVAPSISAPDADQAAVYDLNDEIAALTITASGYPTPTYQWYSNSSASTEGATAIEGAQSASYTPANDVASDLYYYCVATNSQGSATSHYFHVTVNAPAVPTIYTETTALTLTSNKVATASETFTFSGANLGETAVTLVLASAVDGFTLSESSVTPTAGAIADTEVTVSYKSVVDVAEASVNLYLKQGDDILKTIVLTYSSTAGIESLTSISAATTWDWNGAADAAYGTLGQNDMIVLANADVTWDAGFNANAIAGKLQYYYRDSKYAQGHELKFNTTIPGRVTVTFSNTGGKDIARAPRITDVNGSYAPTDEADGSKNTTAKTYTHNVAAGDVLIAGFEMQTGNPANMLRYYKVEFVPTYTVAYAANGGSGDMTDANAYVAGDEVTLLANTFTPASGYVWSGWVVTKTASGDPIEVSEGKFTMPAEAVTVTAQWEDNSKVAVIVETSAKYESLAEAIAVAEAGQTVQLIQDITQEEAILIDKNLTLDLNNKTFTVTNPSSEYSNRAIKVTAGTIVIENGTVDALSNETHNGGCWGSLRQEGGHLTCNNVTFKNYRSGGLGLKPVGGTLILNECTVLSEFGGGLELGNATVEVNNCTFTQTGTDANKIYGACFGMGKMGTLTINGGTYTSDNYSFYIYTSGGTINVNSGTFAGDIKTEMNNTQYPSAVGTINISGGTFDGVGENPIVLTTVTANDHISISGGVFDAPILPEYCAENYVPKDNGDGTYGVKPKDGVCIIKVATTGGTNKTVTGLYAGEGDVSLSSNTKMDNGKYIGFTLDGTTLQAGDRINVHTSQAANTAGSHIIFYDNMTDKNELYDTEEIGGEGDNIFEVNAAMIGATTAYVYRSNADAAHQWNGYVDYIEVTRPMKPMLTAITIDGRDGVINEAAKTVAVTIPYEANLAALTVVPTIVWNEAAATNSIVVNDGSAWIEGANTYKLTDKDGDYTVYTITLTRDVLKHTVSFNTHGGSAVASEEVVHGEYLAAAPADPEKEENVFKHWAETEDGEAVDVTTVQINADKTFHAVWEAEPAGIKLITDLGLNTTDFVSPALAEDSILVNTVKYPYLVQFGSNKSSFSSITKADMVQYNATTNATKMKVTLYNSSTSEKKAYLYMWEEGAAGDDVVKEEITLPGKQITTSEYYEFNSNKNRSFYVCMDDRSNTRVLQVKVIESGDAIHQFGQMGYSLNFNKGRLYAKDGVATSFEGFNFTVASEYKVNNQTTFQSKAVNSFSITSPVIMHVERSSGKYYVYQDPANKGTLYDATADIELNATGTWYICSETSSSSVSLTGISFTAPKCAEPAFNALANSDVCAGDGYVALDGTATVADAGVPTYQWYREDDSAIDGETNATYTPTADGKYYVIAVNHLAGYTDNEKKSALVTVTTHAGTAISEPLADQRGNVDAVVALEVAASGKNLHYAWKECATIDGEYTAVAGAADAASLDVTITEGMDKYYKVIVSSDCGDAQESVAHVTQYVPVAQANVTGSIAWNWANAASVNEIKLTSETSPKKNEGFVMANGAATVYNNANFESDKLYLEGEYIVRDGKYFQGQTIKFNTTVAGVVRVKFSHTGNNKPARELYINGVGTGDSRTNATAAWSRYVDVPAGEVTITAYHVDPADGAGQQYIRVPEIEFLTIAHRRTTGYNVGDLGTVCLEDATIIDGATLYELQGLDEHGYLAFDEIQSGELEAGKPYLFEVTNPSQISFYKPVGAAHSDTEIETNGMIGTFSGTTLYQGAENYYYFSGRHIWKVNDFTVAIPIPANRCYVDYDVLLAAPAPLAPAPGRRRVTMGVQGTQVATGCENLNVSDKPVKMIIDGQLFIIRGEKMYDAKGQLVK